MTTSNLTTALLRWFPLVARQLPSQCAQFITLRNKRTGNSHSSPALARRRAGHVATPVGNRVDQSLLAQHRHRAPRRRARDLELLDDLALGRYPRIRPVLTSPDPPPDDLRYLLVRGNRSNRVNPVSAPICHRDNFNCMRLTSYVCGQADAGLGKLQESAGSFGRPVRVPVSRDPAGTGSPPLGRLLPAPTSSERTDKDAARRRFRRYR